MERPKAEDLDALMQALAVYNEGRKLRDRPQRFVVYFSAPDPAAFIHQNIVAAWAIRRFANSYALALFREAPGYGFLTDCNEAIRSTMEVEADADMVMPLDWFDVSVNPPNPCPVQAWYDRGMNEPDQVLLPAMLDTEAALIDGLAEAPPAFRLPEDRAAALVEGLFHKGLPALGWFALLDLPDAAEATRLVIDRGGIPVLGGACGMSGTPPQGTVDLRGDTAALPLLAAAVSRARCVLAGPGTTLALASAFRVPAAGIGLDGPGRMLWNRGDLPVAPQRLPEALDRLLARQPEADREPETPGLLRYPFPLRDRTLLEVLK